MYRLEIVGIFVDFGPTLFPEDYAAIQTYVLKFIIYERLR